MAAAVLVTCEDGGVNVDVLARLQTPEGRAALDVAAGLPADPLAAASAMRARGFDPDLAAAALTQVELRRRAAAKFGPDAAGMFFTRAGLEQATRRPVADARAARLAAAGVASIVDLGSGIGADSRAFIRAGLAVRAIDADPLTAAIASVNLGIDVGCTRAEDVPLDGVDAAFCDPARRSGSSRIFHPDAFSPSWTFVSHLVTAVPRTVVKLAPGIDHALIPPAAEAEWVSVDGDVVEAAFWCGPLASVPRRATLFGSTGVASLTGSGTEAAPLGSVGPVVYDPDGAVVRAHLVAELATEVGGTIADPTIAYVYAPSYVPTPFARGYLVEDVMGFSLKRLRAEVRRRDIGVLTIKKRGSALEPETLRRQLRLSGTETATIILTRVDGAPTVLFVRPV